MFTRVIDDHRGDWDGGNGNQFTDLAGRSSESAAGRADADAASGSAANFCAGNVYLRRSAATGAALTVVNAPVGYGKTSLLRLWCIERPEAGVWMTLDAADDDPVRLWTQLATRSTGSVGVLEVRC